MNTLLDRHSDLEALNGFTLYQLNPKNALSDPSDAFKTLLTN